MQAIISHAEGALLDQRSIQPRFKEGQLDVLFKTLQENGDSLIEQLASGAPGITPRLEAELAVALVAINELSNELPAPGLWWKTQTKLPHAAAEKHLPLGVVAIEANTYHPILSIIVPLACSIAAGNAAVITNISTAGQSYIAKLLKRVLDQDLYHFSESTNETSNSFSARIGLAISASPAKAGQVAYKPALGPVPVLIDQSCLEGKPLPHPLDNPSYPVPKLLRKAARELSKVISFEKETRKNATWRSSSSPSYVLVHENILPLFQRAIQEEGIQSHFKPQSLANAQAILSALPSPTSLQYIPVFSCTSLDKAIDFVNNEAPSPTISYIFADPNFSAYAANQLAGEDVVIGGIPEAVIVQGPYRKLARMQFYKVKSIELASIIDKQLVKKRWSELAAKVIKRRSDKRIDFFFSGILLSFGLAASGVLGLTGFGAYKAVVLAVRYYKRVHMS